ncbi:MAG: hypothetical protein IJP17_01265, partial [Clostridia bacterium]|nr:hypothetical protein [Clostridia bacterium]
ESEPEVEAESEAESVAESEAEAKSKTSSPTSKLSKAFRNLGIVAFIKGLFRSGSTDAKATDAATIEGEPAEAPTLVWTETADTVAPISADKDISKTQEDILRENIPTSDAAPRPISDDAAPARPNDFERQGGLFAFGIKKKGVTYYENYAEHISVAQPEQEDIPTAGVVIESSRDITSPGSRESFRSADDGFSAISFDDAEDYEDTFSDDDDYAYDESVSDDDFSRGDEEDILEPEEDILEPEPEVIPNTLGNNPDEGFFDFGEGGWDSFPWD